MKKYDFNRSVEPLRAVVLPRVLGKGLESVSRKDRVEAEVWVLRVVREVGASGSCNQYKLAVAAGHALGEVSDVELAEVVAGELRCCWYRARCGVPNEQPVDYTHGALNFLCDTYAAKQGIVGAEDAIGRLFRLISEVDAHQTGHPIGCGGRTSADFAQAKRAKEVPVADFGDPAARALAGQKLKLSNKPSSQDAVAIVQRDFPHILEAPEAYELPALLFPMEIEQRERGVVTRCPTAKDRTGRYGLVTSTWAEVDGNRVVAWGYEDDPPLNRLGEVLSVLVTPQGITG